MPPVREWGTPGAGLPGSEAYLRRGSGTTAGSPWWGGGERAASAAEGEGAAPGRGVELEALPLSSGVVPPTPIPRARKSAGMTKEPPGGEVVELHASAKVAPSGHAVEEVHQELEAETPSGAAVETHPEAGSEPPNGAAVAVRPEGESAPPSAGEVGECEGRAQDYLRGESACPGLQMPGRETREGGDLLCLFLSKGKGSQGKEGDGRIEGGGCQGQCAAQLGEAASRSEG